MKKVLWLFVCLLIAASPITGALAESDAAETRIFVDSVGREVEVPVQIDRIAPSGKMAHIVLYALAEDKFVCLSNAWTADAETYIAPEVLELPVVGQLYGSSTLNVEALAASDPQVVIDIGEPKDSVAEDMDAIEQQLGIPAVFIEMTTETAGDAYRMLGDLLGLEEEAETLAAYCEEIYANTVDTMATIPQDERVRLAYCMGEDGLSVIGKGSYHAEVIDLVSDNVALIDNPSTKGTGDVVDFEQLYLWDPQVVLFAPESAYDKVGGDEAWLALPAIESGNYYEVPCGPFNWMGFPPSVNRYIGMIWLSELLYPDAFDYDLLAETQRYYQLFYHYDLSEEQFNQLCANSLA